MALKYKIVYTPRAQEEIAKIIDGILEVSLSKRSAEKWFNKIFDRTESLSTMPNRFPILEGGSGLRSANVGKYKILYKVRDKEQVVEIASVVYARRNLGRIIKKLGR